MISNGIPGRHTDACHASYKEFRALELERLESRKRFIALLREREALRAACPKCRRMREEWEQEKQKKIPGGIEP